MQRELEQKDLAAAIERTARQVRNLTKRGVFKQVASATNRNKLVYLWPESLHAWIQHRLDQEQERSTATSREQAEEDRIIADARLKQVKLAQLQNELVTRAAARQEIARVLALIAQVMNTFPNRYGHTLPGEAPLGEKVAALRRVRREVFEELRRAGHDVEHEGDEDTDAREASP